MVTNNVTDDYGFDIKQRIGISVVYFIISFTGITGNTCVLLAVLLSKKLHTLTNILVVNLSVTDFLTCCSLLVQCVVLLTSEQVLMVVPMQLCVLTSAVNIVGVANSLMTLTLIAFMRWYVITRSIRGHRGLHTPGKIAAMLTITWTVSLVSMLLLPGLGVGTLGYSAVYNQCLTIDDNQLVVYYSMLQGGGCFAFVAMAISFYIAIFLFVRKNTVAIVDDRNPRSEDLHQMAALFRKREWRITKNLLVVFCIFLVCFIPSAITLSIPGGSLLNVYTTTLLYTSPCINPIVYCLKHDQFKEVFRPMLRCRWSKIPQPTKILRCCFPRAGHDLQLTSITSLNAIIHRV